jgi:hypothetical protein
VCQQPEHSSVYYYITLNKTQRNITYHIIMDMDSKLDSLYSQVNNQYNKYSNILDRKQERHRTHQPDIATRAQLIRESQYQESVRDLYISLAWIFIYMILFLVFPWVAYMSNIISYRSALYIVVITIIAFLAYLPYRMNAFFFRTNFSNANKTIADELVAVGGYFGDELYKEGKRLERDAQRFIATNCDCKKK